MSWQCFYYSKPLSWNLSFLELFPTPADHFTPKKGGGWFFKQHQQYLYINNISLYVHKSRYKHVHKAAHV